MRWPGSWPRQRATQHGVRRTVVSLHHGGGVGMGFYQHAGMVIVADGTQDAARRLERVLWNDPATGVMRHADAGYQIANRLRPRAPVEPAWHSSGEWAPAPSSTAADHRVMQLEELWRRRRRRRMGGVAARRRGLTISTGAFSMAQCRDRWIEFFARFRAVDRTRRISWAAYPFYGVARVQS